MTTGRGEKMGRRGVLLLNLYQVVFWLRVFTRKKWCLFGRLLFSVTLLITVSPERQPLTPACKKKLKLILEYVFKV